jgi:peptidoglycan glycosyltransferase
VLFSVLVVFTSRWTVLEAESLEDMSANRRPLIEEQKRPRGLIFARDGTVLARSRGEGRGEDRIFSRLYPTGPLFSHAIGYSFIERGRSGVEQFRHDELAGREDEFESILAGLENRDEEGNDLRTNLDAEAQRQAVAALGGRAGSIVAIEPRTGKVRVMVSVPDYDPNQIVDRFGELNRAEGSPLLNRATQARYPPGSTFKVVTAAAALDKGEFSPTSVVDGSSPKTISGVPLANFGGQDFGPISLTDALTNSVNTVWAQVGVRLGKETMYDYMERFGFNQKPPLDYPREQMDSSGVFQKGSLLTDDDPVDIGRAAIGQERLQVTPLQMAMVAAAVGNGGKLMKPHLVDRVVRKDGRTKQVIEPDLQSQVISEKAAGELAEMMSRVVEEGSGTAAALQGVPVAGKTGTAEVEGGASNQAWFIAFAPVERPRAAIAVTVERTQGQGGTVAAPLAKRVLEILLRNR